ncbi:hypothetical protein SB394_21585 [Burkholderia sp. BCCIQ04A]|uniref:CsbD family protein n=1 Tax=Burkholderia anthinoferrum TaxID=3090833 RepID=A0ABU5WXJ3_9BURK|nr:MULTISPECIES: hypothetical protein [Burkholderia]MEB2508024.1 hypothetical protein [Burkholderia anthinoferrum]MEB2535632.1 hypothetical protein [Burkholderia anthinoferrum]MEB2565256.1 hypothetical protein [Burkholderia anthinoferrum]MEB2583634.1 hypothetical protein [Burkholderia anthinoferrum]MCA8105761.1 hypothetical protein [Burkholderia sp. AU36459]
MGNFLKGARALLSAKQGNERMQKGAQQMLDGMLKARAEFEDKKKEIENEIRRGAKRTNHKLPL